MHHYPHHIGDFRSGSMYMSRLERWLYRDLIEVYYDTEKPLALDLDIVCRAIGVRDEQERQLVDSILRFKFKRTEDGYRNDRCDREIDSYRKKAETARANGKSGGRPKTMKSDAEARGKNPVGSNPDAIGLQVASGLKTNQEPVTSNQEPVTKGRAETQRATRLRSDWQPSDEEIAFCKRERADLDPIATANRFRDYWIAQPGAKGRKADWFATWRNWVRSENQLGRGQKDRPIKFDPTAYVNQGVRHGAGSAIFTGDDNIIDVKAQFVDQPTSLE